MKVLSRLVLTCCLALCAGSTLRAQDVQFGVQLAFASPQGDLSNTGVDNGTSIVISVNDHLGDGHMLRPRFDFTNFPAKSGYVGRITAKSFGVDYVYHVTGKPQGFYVTGGLSIIRWQLDNSYRTYTDATFSESLGAGYQFGPLVGLEVREILSKPSYAGFSVDSNHLTFGVNFRF